MLLDGSRDIAAGATLRADVCIVGAGAAGIALALELQRTGREILLVESGGFEPTPATDDLNVGEAHGDVDATYLTQGRVRAFGGSTNHWGGMVAPLDPEVFEARPWMGSALAWPFAHDALVPWYDAAYRLIGEDPHPRGDDEAAGPFRRPWDGADGLDLLRTRAASILRFGTEHRAAVVDHPRTRVLLHATATVGTARDGRVVRWDVVGGDGRRFQIEANDVVLATSGLENPRLLLASPTVLAQMPPAARDHVGRHLSGHLTYPGAARLLLEGDAGAGARDALQRGEASWRMFALSTDAARRHAVANAAFTPRDPADGPILGHATTAFDAALAGTQRWLHGSGPPWSRHLDVQWEAVAHPDNRVTLTDAVDATGLPRLRVDATVRPADMANLQHLLDAVDAELGRAGRGRAVIGVDPDERHQEVAYDTHYLGTTRMAARPEDGVTDGEGRVHGLTNLYVAGSGLFPAAGWANATLTILALAARQAAHLGARSNP